MKKSIEWMVGGQQGDGIDSTGEMFAKALVKSGLHVSTYKQFMSRIKGGHTNYKIKATIEKNFYAGEEVDVLLCLDKETLPANLHQLKKGSVVITEGRETKVELSELGYILAEFPLKQMATELGNPMAKNMIALGISGALFSVERKHFHEFIEDIFAKKGNDVISSNKKAIDKGYELQKEYLDAHGMKVDFVLEETKDHLFISGNEATAFGSLMAGCRFLSAYPITPATEVMEWLAKELPGVGGTVMQVEDEIAGICFAIGASHSGARAMTSTSGPGLSLKTEALGMAGMAEVPLVIVNSQRGGPSTGLPTKHEQSDIQHMIYGGHGEFPRIVLYPATIEDAFYVAMESFNLAEKYQCPVIIALDLGMSMNKMTVPSFDPTRVGIDRGKLLSSDEASAFDEPHFKRYRLTEDGISPRPLPGMKDAVHTTSSNEHDESGYISENTDNRVAMMKKRMDKIKDASIQNPYKTGNENGDIVLIGMGSTYGVIQEAVMNLKNEGMEVEHIHIQQLFPLPSKELQDVIGNRKVITIENNFNGQLLNWIKQHIPIHDRCDSIIKYDGNPFTAAEIVNQLKEMV